MDKLPLERQLDLVKSARFGSIFVEAQGKKVVLRKQKRRRPGGVLCLLAVFIVLLAVLTFLFK